MPRASRTGGGMRAQMMRKGLSQGKNLLFSSFSYRAVPMGRVLCALPVDFELCTPTAQETLRKTSVERRRDASGDCSIRSKSEDGRCGDARLRWLNIDAPLCARCTGPSVIYGV
jgi:hypothetical protein